MKMRSLWTMGLITVVALLAWAPPGAAYWPPCQVVTGPTWEGAGVSFKVYNFATNTYALGYYDLPGGYYIVQTKSNGGIVAWRAYNGSQSQIGYATYDPVRGWIVGTSEVLDHNVYLDDVRDGMVRYSKSFINQTSRFFSEYCRTYDPGLGLWQDDYWDFVAPTLGMGYLKDIQCINGVFAFVHNLTSSGGDMLCYEVYDPTRPGGYQWGTEGGAAGDTITNFSIDPVTATLYYTLNGVGQSKGYSVANGAWQYGLNEAYAAFVAQPTSGNAPLTVWVTDMSLGAVAGGAGVTFGYEWGDGTAASTNRSGFHTYTGVNQYTLSHRVTRAGSYPAVDTRTTVITTDFTPPTGSISFTGAFTNTPFVKLNLSATDNSGSVAQMWLGNDGEMWQGPFPYATYAILVLPPGDGPKKVWARFADAAGNQSTPTSATITLDTVKPTLGNPAVVINGGALYTGSAAATLTFSVTDPGGSGVTEWAHGTYDPRTQAWLFSDWIPIANTGYVLLPFQIDGSKTVTVRFRDAAGNISDNATSAPITLDTTGPTGTVAIAGGAAYTGSTGVTLNLTYDDGGGIGADQMRFSNSTDFSAATWIPVAATAPWTLAAGADGTRTVYAQFKDKLNNISSATIYDDIILDTQPPTGTVVINGGADFTNSLAVTLTLNATDGTGSGLDKMRFSNDGVGWSAEQTYAPSYGPWNLSAGADGSRKVYARFKDKLGNYSTTEISDTIVLDTTAPSGNITINNGDAYTTSTAVNLTLAATDGTGSGLDKMRFNDTGTFGSEPWADYATSAPYTLPGGDGLKKVYAQFMDKAGNISAAVSASITLDATAPTGTIAISGGAYTRIAAVVLNLTSAGGATQMCFSANQTSWSAWENVATTKQYNLAAPDGLKWIYVKYRDAAGNESAPAGASVTLDTVAPKDGTLTATPGRQQVTLKWSGFSDATSGIQSYQLFYSPTEYPTAATGTKIYEGVETTFEHKGMTNGKPCYYRLCAVDKAGNVSTGATAAATPKAGGALVFLNLLLD